jgi:erythromycin esterase-like protein
MAASDWGAAAERKNVKTALDGSYENLFHTTGTARFFLPLTESTNAHALLAQPKLERAIGVIYRPDTERQSHYFHARLAHQFDAVIHFDETQAVEPLAGLETWPEEEVPETFPSGV